MTVRLASAVTGVTLLTLLAAVLTGLFASSAGAGRGDVQSTELISRSATGGLPNGPSAHAVISGDRRYARVIAFESSATNLVGGDTNGQQDVFAIKRAGSVGNNGSPWKPGRNILVSRGLAGKPANGPSADPAVDGDFVSAARCVAFRSAASNLVRGDTNGKVDAFVSKGPGGAPERLSLLSGNKQVTGHVEAVTVSGGCDAFAFVVGGKLYLRQGRRTTKIPTKGAAGNPSFSIGKATVDVVFDDKGGVYLSRAGGKPSLVGPGGSDPVMSDIATRKGRRAQIAYEKVMGGRTQVVFGDLGGKLKVASAFGSQLGDGPSRDPVIGNAGFYVAFESDATNLQTNAGGARADDNDRPDAYLRSDVRKLTLVQSVEEKGVPVPGGGKNPSMSYYANYIVFGSPAPLGTEEAGFDQIHLRYLGPV